METDIGQVNRINYYVKVGKLCFACYGYDGSMHEEKKILVKKTLDAIGEGCENSGELKRLCMLCNEFLNGKQKFVFEESSLVLEKWFNSIIFQRRYLEGKE